MQKRRRVAITGIGAVTPIGITAAGLWNGLRAQKSAIRTLSRFDASQFRSHNAAEVRDFEPGDFMEKKRAKRLDRFGHFAVAASRLALEDSRLDLAKENRERIGANMGSALGGVGYAEEQFSIFMREGIGHVEPQLALNVYIGAACCNVAIEFGLQGPNNTNGMSCASGTMGVGEAFRLIRDDYADVMVCGGVEAPLMPLCFAAFTIIRAMSTR
ncbi:MAG TPA: beta-ketoacyl synthase N-terminal-like domain-containing protein, partial [Gemmatimonadaceae bacterium]